MLGFDAFSFIRLPRPVEDYLENVVLGRVIVIGETAMIYEKTITTALLSMSTMRL